MSVELKGFDKFTKRLEEIQKRGADVSKTTAVGFPAKVGSTELVKAASNEYGAVAGNGAVIPARPFLRPALHDPALAAFVKKQAANYYKGAQDLVQALSRIGVYAVSLIQRRIGSDTPPPNAPSTIARKGSSKTLIDTGRMRQSVSYEIVEKK